MEFADEYPSATVIGTDLSPIQPGFVPPNVQFYVDDFEQPWEFGESGKFDYIHWRSLCGSTGDWLKLYTQAWENLKEGAWLEVQEYDAWVYSDEDEKMTKAPWTREWCEMMTDVTMRSQKPLNVARFAKRWMEEAGFVDVREEICKVGDVLLLLRLNLCKFAYLLRNV